MTQEYQEIIALLQAVLEPAYPQTSNLANAAAVLYERLDRINWAGFYLCGSDALWLGPFQGRAACVRIEKGKGVCGTAWAEGRTVLVPDVHAFPGHIACDSASRSEIVVPLWKAGEVCGVLDIDSPVRERFGTADREGLEAAARLLETVL